MIEKLKQLRTLADDLNTLCDRLETVVDDMGASMDRGVFPTKAKVKKMEALSLEVKNARALLWEETEKLENLALQS